LTQTHRAILQILSVGTSRINFRFPCIRFGIAPKFCDHIPEEYANLDTKEKRAVLGEIRRMANEMIGRVNRNLYAMWQQQKNQPER